MGKGDVILVGRSSSHFTRTARIFALELGITHVFRPVFDMTTVDLATYGDNPALKVPVMVDDDGPLFGTDNICRALTLRSGQRDRVVLRGDVDARVVANAEELILHAMSTEVIVITLTAPGKAEALPPKVRRSLENSLTFLETNLDAMLAALPRGRTLSFCETMLFCLVTHLPFRKVMAMDGYPRLVAFAASFGQREAARTTEYHFDAPT